MGVFKEENHRIIIDPEVKFIPAFAKLIARDKDRQKRNAQKELAYVYYVCDFLSPYNIYDSEERDIRSQRACNFKDGWKKDVVIKKAIEQYQELQKTPAIQSLESIRESLFTALKAVKFVRAQLNAQIEFFTQESDPDVEVDTENLIKTVNELLKLADKIPNSISTLEAVEEKVKK